MPKVKKISLNFCYSFYEDQSYLKYYTQLPGQFYDSKPPRDNPDNAIESTVVCVQTIPPYLGISPEHITPGYGVYNWSYQLGFAIDLTTFKSTEEFLKSQFNKKVYKNLRQDKARLERDFEIGFKIYHREISKNKYEFLMSTLKEFISGRFEGRTSRHAALKRWDHYEKTVFEQILNGTASFFVLYNQDTPLCIALNYHHKSILYAAIISFDQDFRRYSLGRQMFCKQIEWSLKNGYKLIDLAWGSFDYKIKFSNAVYKYQTHVLYPKINLLARLMALLYISKMFIIYYLVMLRDKRFRSPRITYKDRWLTNFSLYDPVRDTITSKSQID